MTAERKRRAFAFPADKLGLNADADELIRYLDGHDSAISDKMEEMLQRVVETKALILEHKTYGRTVKILKKVHGYSESTAWRDIKLVERVIGNLVRASKDVKRAIAEEMILQSKELAIRNDDTKALAAIDANYIKLHQLDKEDPEELDASHYDFSTILFAVIPDQVGVDPPNDDELMERFRNWLPNNSSETNYEEVEDED